ncbi:preprotein translocase subunit YajC [Nocardioides abyssi]|uniref:Preprotein translocase subunit YajC n=1 Tax=Nocardioides abyssi TaxID=3058370 RepID=A0ABT8ETV7_9ACTN|nr:preprotein translocase subunit YajC [Nocardioides abyssi]MDN4161605.1 preprotein translocase subunit YajC [Nocardioides abyssi]
MELASLLPLVGIALLFWLLIIRPASRRQKELTRMQSSLGVGDEVVLTSGFLGTIRELTDDTARVEIAEGVVVTVARGAIGTVAQPRPAELGEPEEI